MNWCSEARQYKVQVGDDDDDDDDDVGLNVLGCRADILGTNCNKLLKLKINGGGGGGAVASASVECPGVGGGGGGPRRLNSW